MTDKTQARAELREFLMTRRARISPDDAGVAVFGGARRVKGLRREEVAMLAGVSVDYYVRLERGNATGASNSVIEAIAGALALDDVEREHLRDLVEAVDNAGRSGRRRPTRSTRSRIELRPGVRLFLDSITDLPAFVFNRHLDVVGVNRLGRLLYEPMFDRHGRLNTARFLFLDDRAVDLWPHWHKMADDVVAVLRAESGRDPDHPALIELVGQLSTRSPEFRRRWAAHDVRRHESGVKVLDHPLVGRLTLPFENLHVAADTEVSIMVYTPQPGSPTHDALQMLSSWAAVETIDGPAPASDCAAPTARAATPRQGDVPPPGATS